MYCASCGLCYCTDRAARCDSAKQKSPCHRQTKTRHLIGQKGTCCNIWDTYCVCNIVAECTSRFYEEHLLAVFYIRLLIGPCHYSLVFTYGCVDVLCYNNNYNVSHECIYMIKLSSCCSILIWMEEYRLEQQHEDHFKNPNWSDISFYQRWYM